MAYIGDEVMFGLLMTVLAIQKYKIIYFIKLNKPLSKSVTDVEPCEMSDVSKLLPFVYSSAKTQLNSSDSSVRFYMFAGGKHMCQTARADFC